MKAYRMWIQHKANPLHIYCRLVDMGLGVAFSRRLGVLYERYVHSLSKDVLSGWRYLKKKFWSWV